MNEVWTYDDTVNFAPNSFYGLTQKIIFHVPEGSESTYESRLANVAQWDPTFSYEVVEIVENVENVNTGVVVDIVISTVFVGIVFTLLIMFISLGKKKKRLI